MAPNRHYDKACTVTVTVGDNSKYKAKAVWELAENVSGTGSVLACVPKGGDCYELTVENKEQAQLLSSGTVGEENKKFTCELLFSDTLVVSFMHLPAYIEDDVIEDKLKERGIELQSEIFRRCHPGTSVADGTKYVRCRFPPSVTALPYTMKFKTHEGDKYFKVKHNNQVTVCYKCLSAEHA